MSRRYLIPVKFTCDTYGCAGEAMGHEEFQLSGKYKLEQKSSSSDSLPEGWSQKPYEGDQCPACTTKEEQRQAARIANFKQAVKTELTTPGPLPGQPALHPGVAKAAEALKETRQLVTVLDQDETLLVPATEVVVHRTSGGQSVGEVLPVRGVYGIGGGEPKGVIAGCSDCKPGRPCYGHGHGA